MTKRVTDVSLRTRLLLALLAASVVGLAIVGVLTYTLVTRAQIDQVDDELQRAHPPIERAAATAGADLEQAIRDAAPGFYVEVRDAGGTSTLVVPMRSPGDDDDGIVLDDDLPQPDTDHRGDRPVFATLDSTDDHAMRVRISLQPDDSLLVIGRSLGSVEETRERLMLVLVVASAGAVAVAALVGVWLVRVGLRPLTAVERATSGITDADLDRRVPAGATTTEVGRLATAVNRMLDRLQRAFEQREQDLADVQASEARMRQFVADASHELRTPLAATAAYAELFDRGARDRPDDLERAMRGIRSETGRMASLVEDLLLLAQLDEGRPLAELPVDLAELAVAAVDAARAVAPERVVQLRVDDVPVVTGDPGRLRQVIDNLLANVRTHTAPDSRCTVTVRRDGDDAVLLVSDDGPGMPSGDATHAFDRFHRADASRARSSGGAGLGLAIVAAIVAAHHGTVTMTSALGAGTTVTVQLPIVRSTT